MYNVSRTDRERNKHNTIVLRRPKLSHISVLLRSNSGAVPLANRAYKIFLKGGKELQGTTDEDGLVYHSKVPPGDYLMEIEGLGHRIEVPTMPPHIVRRPIRVNSFFLFPEEDKYPDEPLLTEEQDQTNLQPLGEIEESGEMWEEVETYEQEEPDDG